MWSTWKELKNWLFPKPIPFKVDNSITCHSRSSKKTPLGFRFRCYVFLICSQHMTSLELFFWTDVPLGTLYYICIYKPLKFFCSINRKGGRYGKSENILSIMHSFIKAIMGWWWFNTIQLNFIGNICKNWDSRGLYQFVLRRQFMW